MFQLKKVNDLPPSEFLVDFFHLSQGNAEYINLNSFIMNTSANNTAIEKLQEIVNTNSKNIKSIVAKEALAYSSDNIQIFFSDILQYGCISGMISSLIYYVDTHEFYDTHYSEIEDIRKDYEAQTGQYLTTDSDLKNFFAWFAFEETAYRLANELELEI